MTTRRDNIQALLERSSLGAADARRARAQVSKATARAVLTRSTRSATSGKFTSSRGMRRR